MSHLLNDLRFHAKLGVARARLRACHALGRPPVVTYATLRTSSSAVHWALRRAVGWRAIKAHALLPQRLVTTRTLDMTPAGEHGLPVSRHVGDWAVHHQVIRPGRPAFFVILIRDPVAVAVSIYSMFSTLGLTLRDPREQQRWAEGAHDEATFEQLAAAVVDDPAFWWHMPRWIEHDVGGVMGWDVLSIPFPREEGFLAVQRGPWNVLLLRADVEDQVKSRVLSQFIGTTDAGVEVRRENSGRSHGLGGLAAAVTQAVRRRPEGVDALLGGAFTRHFWTEAQIDAMRRRWLGNT